MSRWYYEAQPAETLRLDRAGDVIFDGNGSCGSPPAHNDRTEAG